MTDIAHARVDNPYATDAILDDIRQKRPSDINAAKIDVLMNMRLVIGGFCRWKGTTQAQRKAAARFKTLAERSTVGGSSAIDTTKEPVDGGYINPEGVMISGEHARRELNTIHRVLGKPAYKHFWYVVVGENGPTAYARLRGGNPRPRGRDVTTFIGEIPAIATSLAEFWGYQTRP